MENREDKKIDELMKKIMVGSKQESPSLGFSSSVMREIEALASKPKIATPLISRKVWITLGIAYAALMVVLINSIDFQSSTWMSSFNWTRITEYFSISAYNSLQIPSTVIYALTTVSVLFLIQMFFLKKLSDRSINAL